MVGLFFGSFNPIHIGHMALANYMLAYEDLRELWFVVTPHNPLKDKSSLLDFRQRMHMVRLAIGDNPKMKASDIENGLPQPSYTVNTLAHLKEKFPSKKFALIMGADNIQSFNKWKNYEQILNNNKILVYPRPGYDCSNWLQYDAVKLTGAPVMEISSSFIRKAIKEKKDPRYFVPEQAWNYLQEMHFYED